MLTPVPTVGLKLMNGNSILNMKTSATATAMIALIGGLNVKKRKETNNETRP